MLEIAERPDRVVDCFAKQTYNIPDALHILGRNGGTAEENFVELAAIAAQMEVEASDLGSFSIMSQPDGDKRVVWCRKVIAEISAAKQMFLDLIKKGMIPYKVGIDGQASSDEMKEFDATAEEVIFVPLKAIAGG